MTTQLKRSNALPGDLIEIELSKIIYQGTLLESPENEKSILLLKLDSGYNIGLNKKDILKIKVLKKYFQEKSKTKEQEISKSKDKPDIGMIITGGTIAAKLNPKKGGVDWLTSTKDLFKYYPELFDIVNVTKIEIPFMKASEDMDYLDWKKIAKTAEKLLKNPNIKGIIITHGTDFLHYTASALSFMLRNLNKPVVLTYSQRSIDRASSDANLNLKSAGLVAISNIAEVVLVGHANSSDNYCNVMQGTKVRKNHSSKRDAFQSINSKPLARINPENKTINILNQNFKTRNTKNKIKIDTKFNNKVALIKIYPGQPPEILDFYKKQKYNGLILEMSGLGHAPTKRSRTSWTNKLKQIQKSGIIVCATTQCINGRTNPFVYSNGRELLDTGIIYLNDMLSETALVKLSWVLGHEDWSKNKKIIKEKMLYNFSKEISKRLEK
ncbi:MAG: Glu-tRNA(Gln) amidotransferase subunit GatD [Nanoarchaeota archaeon]